MGARLKDTLLIVGDANSSRGDLREIFRETYHILEAENLAQAILLLEQNADCVALSIMEIDTPTPDEMKRLTEVAFMGTEKEIPIVVLVDEDDMEEEDTAFLMGATDVIRKPYSKLSIQKRIQIIVKVFLHKWTLEKMVSDQSETIRHANQTMMDTMSAIIEYRSTESGNHVLRIRRFTRILLEEVARFCPEYGLTSEIIDIISSAAALHDMGKISIPDAILNKPGRLTPEEFEVMKTHSYVGSQLVKQLSGMGEELYLRYAYNISLYHHERWDGRGYPCGLVGDEIPICAQVVGLADVFDALTTKRVYKPAYPYQSAVNMILNGECGVFSPKLLECFKNVRTQFVRLARDYADGLSPKDDGIEVPLPKPDNSVGTQDTLQLFQSKYQTLLHYINDTVIELDLDHDISHVLYNPNPVFDSRILESSFREIMRKLRLTGLHPQDFAVVDEMEDFVQNGFFRSNARRRSFHLRIYSPSKGRYKTYEIIYLKVNTGEDQRRLLTAIWRKAEDISMESKAVAGESLTVSPALQGLISNMVRCRCDEMLTMEVGMEHLFSLNGYTEEALKKEFDHQLMRLIVPEDHARVKEALEEAGRSGEKVELEFRMLRKNDTPVWVLAKCRLYVEADGQENYYFAIRDNSQSKAIHDQLVMDIERNQILIDQSGSIVFDWDMLSDTMYCSPKWEERFGYQPVSKNYGSQIGIATHFHPDDLIKIREAVEQIRTEKPTVIMEVRIADSDGKYQWSKITATRMRDFDGNVTRIIGIIQDINDLKRAALILEEKAQKDSLTKLLNKISTQNQIELYLAEKDPKEIGGLLIMDLDNFKSVNDTRGHLYGDVVLTKVGALLQKFFRTQDIIGRIGGAEFMILMKGIPDQKLLESRCQMLVESMRELLQELTPDLQVSCSVGAAMTPNHGSTYSELYQRSDEALYHVKNKGKNQFKIYSFKDKYHSAQDLASRTTRIDSDDPNAVTNESFERFVFRCLYGSQDLDSTVNELLAFVGANFNVSRAYVFENNEDNTTCSNTFEWCNDGIEPQIDDLQDVSYIDDIPGWPEVYNERGVLYCTDITQLAPQFRAILEPQGIKSMLQCAIMDQGVFRGYVGFDECVSNRLWTQDQLHQLEFLAQALAVFLIRQRMVDKK